MITIIINSTDLNIREKLTDLLVNGPLQTRVIGVVGDTESLLHQLEETLPRIVIQYVGSGGEPDLEPLKKIRNPYLGLPVLAVGAQFSDEQVVEIIKAGAMGYIKVQNLKTELAAAVDMLVSMKENFYNREVRTRLSEEIRKINLNARRQRLTQKEHNVMRMIASGFDMKKIAKELDVSVRTVYTY
ncbi:MAG: response regulator transcription factor, partial [Balneolaceae bacterium]|nr:response regulator transcription factor [Balneolaceae bacterium]